MGVGEKQRVIVTKHGNPKLFHEDVDDQEHLISGEFISGNGSTIDPFVIMKGTWHLEKFYFEGGFSPNIIVGFSESGYLTNELVIPLLEHFNERTSKSTAGRWRILIWDEYNTHTDYAIKDWCIKYYILSFTFSSHSTHLLQSLDVVCFQSFKYYY